MTESIHPDHHLTPYSNIQIVLLANRVNMGREVIGTSQCFGLLEIANKPILSHTLSQFQKYGLDNILLVCLNDDEEAYSKYLSSNGYNNVKIFTVSGDMTTCDVLRSVPACEFHLIYPIDLITTIDFTKFIDFHIQRKCAMTAFITEHKLDDREIQSSPGIRANVGSATGLHYLVFDEADPTRLISLLADADALRFDLDLNMKRNSMAREDSTENMDDIDDFTHGMEISAENLQSAKSLIIDRSCHLARSYIISRAGMDFLNECDDIHSIENELLPRLLSKQQSVSLFKDSPNDFTITITDWATLFHVSLRISTGKLGSLVPGSPRVPIGDTGNAYYAPASFAPPEGFRLTPCSVFGENITIGERTVIGRTIIGNGVVIGSGVQMQNCVIFDNAKIEDGTSLRSTIVGSGSVIPAGSKLQQAIILPNYNGTEKLSAEQCLFKPN